MDPLCFKPFVEVADQISEAPPDDIGGLQVAPNEENRDAQVGCGFFGAKPVSCQGCRSPVVLLLAKIHDR